MLFDFLLVPVLLQREMKSIGYFSIFCLTSTLVAVSMVIYLEADIFKNGPEYATGKLKLTLTKQDLEYKLIDWAQIPMFVSTFMCIFEGNSSIMNIYSEVDKPQVFTKQLLVGFIVVILACTCFGLFGYLTFGQSIKSVVLFNLPNEDPLSIATKLCYLITIMGSYVIIIQPVFSLIESKSWYTNLDYKIKFPLARIAVVILTIYVSVMLPDIHLILSLSGSISGTLISVVVPILFYNKAFEFADSSNL